MRRRLKFASLFFERVFLEAGIFRMQAGPGGSFGVVEPPRDGEKPRWQTPAHRHMTQATPFHVSVGREEIPGVPARTMQPALSSDATISWVATLLPFADELPPGTDWIEFTRMRDPAGDMRRLADRWKSADERNPALERAIPVRFVRNAMIGNANRDLAFAAEHGAAVSVDPLHVQVIAQRFNDDDSWKLRGFTVPILFPQVGEWPWEAVADLRRDRNMARFRAILREVEEEVTAEIAGGDVEEAAHRAYRRHLADAQEAVGNVGAIAHRTLNGFVIGGITGFTTLGVVGPKAASRSATRCIGIPACSA